MFRTHFFPAVICLLLLLAGCSPFSKMAAQNNYGREDAYKLVTNEQAGFRLVIYYDFDFAGSRKAMKKLTSEKPPFRNMLLYGQTYQPAYHFYLLLNAEPGSQPGYILKDTLIAGNKITLAISKNAPSSEVEFLTGKLGGLELKPKP